MDVLPTNKQLYPDSLGLNENINTEPLDQDKINEALSGLNNNNNMSLSGIMKQIQQIPAASYNMANDTKWIFHIPYGFLFMGETENRENLEIPLGCQSVNFPDFKIGTTQVGFMGYGIDLSTRQNLTDKGLTINFLINSNWIQYLALLKWFELEDYTPYTKESVDEQAEYNISGVKIDNHGFRSNYELGKDPYWSTQGPQVPAHLYLMDNFNNRIVTILFSNTWLASIKSVPLDYKKTSDTEVVASAEFKFSKFSITLDNDFLIKLFGKHISGETF